MSSDIWEYLPLKDFISPERRIYWPFLLLCLLYAIAYYIFVRKKIVKESLKPWISSSARVDYAIWILNHAIRVSLFPLLFSSSLLYAGRIYFFLTDTFGPCKAAIFMSDWGIVWYAIAFFVTSDFSRFALHYLLHHNRFLWHIHRTHHTAQTLTPFTLFRVHPLEMILFHFRFLVVYAIVTGGFWYLYTDTFSLPKVLGIGIIVFLSNILGANLRHSNVPIGFGWLERLIISPKQHQIHHSKDPSLYNSNMGSFLSIWDRMFSTWVPSQRIGKINFGVSDQPKQSIIGELLHPLMKGWNFLKRKF